MQVELLEPEATEWQEILDNCPHDFYHLPEYVRLTSQDEGGRALGLLVRDRARSLFLPMIVRDIPGTHYQDLVSPYGYPGPLLLGTEEDMEAFLAKASRALTVRLRDEGLVSLFARFHPILNRHLFNLGQGLVVRHNDTVVIDLSQQPEDHWRETRHGHRSEISQALRAGHRSYIDEQCEHMGDFVAAYHQTMERVGAASLYFFSDTYFQALKGVLGETMHLCVVEVGGAFAAGGLFTECSGIVQYHLCGTADAFLNTHPSKLMLHYMRGWARNRGNRWMHLGGGVGAAEDSLFRFKAGFSKLRAPFCSWRTIFDSEIYRELLATRDPAADPQDLCGYFPAYRRPISPADALSKGTR